MFIAMNHTDKYNYWPFQYRMHQLGLRYTATWVKGKYYSHPVTARFLDNMNNIPMPSRGYLMVIRFNKVMGREPVGDEYRALRDLSEENISEEEARRMPGVDAYLDREETDDYGALLEERFIDEVVRIHRDAQSSQALHFLVFPQGTRSVRLSAGRTGMMHMAQHLGLDIVPVGCNGCELLYPGDNPFSRGGKVVYRIGEILKLDGPELSPHRVLEDFKPFSRDANLRHADKMQAATEVVMGRINDLVEPKYQYDKADIEDSPEVRNSVRRFV